MRKCLVLICLLSSCAGWQENLSTDIFKGDEKEPFLTEIAIDRPNAGSVTKKVTIHNPLTVPIRVYLECTSAYQDDPVLDVPARKVKFVWVGAHEYQEYSATCRLTKYLKRSE